MERAAFIAMLGEAPGVTETSKAYEVAHDHKLTLYLGTPGDAMVIAEVATLRLRDTFMVVQSRDDHTTTMLSYDDVQALSVRPPRSADDRRAGFS